MGALVEVLLSFVQRIFVGAYASLFDSLQGIIPEGILSGMSGTISIFGFSVPAFLVYVFFLED